MRRAVIVSFAMSLGAVCATDSTKPAPVAPPEAFTGAWRSVTPSLEFVRLSVTQKPGDAGVLAARITLSGAAWDGEGRIERDSLVTTMMLAGTTLSTGRIVAHAQDDGTLRVALRPTATGVAPLALTLVRDQ